VTQIVYYLDEADDIAHPGKHRYHPDRERPAVMPGKVFLNANNPFQPAKNTVATTVTVSVDGIRLPGKRTDIDSCSVRAGMGRGDRVLYRIARGHRQSRAPDRNTRGPPGPHTQPM
jgi:hypothetical protein